MNKAQLRGRLLLYYNLNPLSPSWGHAFFIYIKNAQITLYWSCGSFNIHWVNPWILPPFFKISFFHSIPLCFLLYSLFFFAFLIKMILYGRSFSFMLLSHEGGLLLLYEAWKRCNKYRRSNSYSWLILFI